MSHSYRWPVVLGITGLTLFMVATWITVQGFGGWNTSFQGPGSTEIEFPAAGEYRLWHESKTIIDGRLHHIGDDLPAGSSIEFNDARGRVVPLQAIRGSMSQEMGSTRRVALGRIEVPAAGTYTVTTTGFDEPRRFRLSEIRFLDHFLRALLFGLPGAVLALAALAWGIVIAVRGRGSNN